MARQIERLSSMAMAAELHLALCDINHKLCATARIVHLRIANSA